jgi:hypothetical protein
MPAPRRHHLLPRFYMRWFADERERITAVPKAGSPSVPSEAYTAHIDHVMVERDFYTLTDAEGVEHYDVEENFAELEALAADALRVLLTNGLVLTDEQRWRWSEFMALQVIRGREFRRMFGALTDQMTKLHLETFANSAPDAVIEEFRAESAARGEPMPDVHAIRRALRHHAAYTVVPTREHTIEMSLGGIEPLRVGFFRMTWKLVRFPEPWLFTGDHPVTYWRDRHPALPDVGMGPLNSNEVRIPLSPSAALILVYPHQVDEPDDAEHPADRETARVLNRDLLLWPPSTQWLATPGDNDRPMPTPASMLQEWRRPWLRGLTYTLRPAHAMTLPSSPPFQRPEAFAP